MTSLKLIFMGTPEFALPTLEALVDSPHVIVAVYTQPPRPAGRGQKERLSPVHAFALTRGLPVLTPVSLKTVEVQKRFHDHQADAAIVAAYGLLLPQPILEGTRMGCINVHPSLLPRWRGAAPIQRTVMAGDRETGVMVMQMDAGLDTGDILLSQRYAIAEGMNAGRLQEELSRLAGPMILHTLAGLARGTIIKIPQQEEGVTYAKKITREECRIDWNEEAEAIRHKILGLSPSPGAFFLHNNEAIKIFAAEIIPTSGQRSPGEVVNEKLHIQCKDNILCPLSLQRPGKRPIPVEEFVKGYAIATGERLS